MRVLTLGTFDVIHSGHMELLEYCAMLAGPEEGCNDVYVGLNTDAFIEFYKGKPPLMPYRERAAVLRGHRRVFKVLPNDQGMGADELSAWPLINHVRPGLIVIGSDWHDRDYLAQLGVTWEQLASIQCSIAYCPRVAGGTSSTLIKSRQASDLLA